jgi:hypothetical protein
MSSAAEAEVGSTFNNDKEAAPLRVVLEEMGHQHPPHPNPNIQFHRIWNIEQQSQSKKIQGNGREVLLGPRQNFARSIKSILGARWQKLSGLFHQASLPHSPQTHAQPICSQQTSPYDTVQRSSTEARCKGVLIQLSTMHA